MKASAHILDTIERLEKFPDSDSQTPDNWLNDKGCHMAICKKHVIIHKIILLAVEYYVSQDNKENEVLNLKKKGIIFVITMLALFICALILIYSINNIKKENKLISTTNTELIYTETISPNEYYVTSEKDIVNYSVEIYQNKENDIIVNADSTSGFFEKLQYVLEYDKTISKQDISIEWTTFMGNPEATADDQLCIAKVRISENGKTFSERKINFINKGIDIVTDMIE